MNEQTFQEAMEAIQNATPMASDPRDVLFVIKTDKGYVCPEGYSDNIADATGYDWLEYPDTIGEYMESIVYTSGGWFTVEIMAPATPL